MAAEYGATCGIFPIDNETLKYLELSGRPPELIALVEDDSAFVKDLVPLRDQFQLRYDGSAFRVDMDPRAFNDYDTAVSQRLGRPGMAGEDISPPV